MKEFLKKAAIYGTCLFTFPVLYLAWIFTCDMDYFSKTITHQNGEVIETRSFKFRTHSEGLKKTDEDVQRAILDEKFQKEKIRKI